MLRPGGLHVRPLLADLTSYAHRLSSRFRKNFSNIYCKTVQASLTLQLRLHDKRAHSPARASHRAAQGSGQTPAPDPSRPRLSAADRRPLRRRLGLLCRCSSSLYSLWALRLTANFSERPAAGLPPLPHRWCHPPAASRVELRAGSSGVLILLVCAAGIGITYGRPTAATRPVETHALAPACGHRQPGRAGRRDHAPRRLLERAVRSRLSRFTIDGTRFASSCFASSASRRPPLTTVEEAAARMLSAVSRRGATPPGAGRGTVLLSDGRVAFVFEIEDAARRARGLCRGDWIDPYDVEGLAMTLGRKACEHLWTGTGWSASSDGPPLLRTVSTRTILCMPPRAAPRALRPSAA